MPKIRLTGPRIESLKATDQEAFYRDTESHLAVRVRPTGSKTFIFMSVLNYKAIRITMGEADARGFLEAKRQAQEWQDLIEKGIDPRQAIKDEAARQEVEKAAEALRQEQQAADDAMRDVLVGDAWSEYIVARTPKWGARHLANHVAMSKAGGEPRGRGRRPGEGKETMPGPVFPLLSVKLRDLDAKAVQAWLEPLAERTPTQAAQCFRALRAFVRWCAEHDDYRVAVHADACTSRAVREAVPRGRVKDDCLQREQLRAWFEHVQRIGNPTISAYLQTLLLTGARRDELASLRWEDVDFQWHSMTIRDKVEGERTIPLTPYVASLLAPLPRRVRTADDCEAASIPYVFSSPTSSSGKLLEPRIQHVKALNAAGLPHVSLHGLRRSFGTLSEWVECPVGVVAQIQGHKPSAIAEKHYRRRPLDLLRMWHCKIEAWILEQAGIEQPAADQGHGLRVVTSNTAA